MNGGAPAHGPDVPELRSFATQFFAHCQRITCCLRPVEGLVEDHIAIKRQGFTELCVPLNLPDLRELRFGLIGVWERQVARAQKCCGSLACVPQVSVGPGKQRVSSEQILPSRRSEPHPLEQRDGADPVSDAETVTCTPSQVVECGIILRIRRKLQCPNTGVSEPSVKCAFRIACSEERSDHARQEPTPFTRMSFQRDRIGVGGLRVSAVKFPGQSPERLSLDRRERSAIQEVHRLGRTLQSQERSRTE